MSVSINGTSGLVFNDASTQNTAATGFGFKNRIINGAMMIDQRNAGASVTLTAANFVYPVDRMFAFRASGTSGAIAQRVSSGITPSGNALRIQRNNGDSATAALGFGQVVESSNCVDLASQSITLSFKARCGANFSGSGSQITARIGTGNGTDQSAANFYNLAWTGQSNTNTALTLTTSWQTFTVTITAGSSVNQVGAMFFYTPSGTASTNDWFEITDLQIEKGSTATSFDYRPYGTELQLCQRYCYVDGYTGNAYTRFPLGYASQTNQTVGFFNFPITMRTVPSLTWSGPFAEVLNSGGGATGTSITITSDGNSASHAAVLFTYSSGTVSQNSLNAIRVNNSTSWYARFEAEL
jgi:hypothetical protein